jgi:hypothetical protein
MENVNGMNVELLKLDTLHDIFTAIMKQAARIRRFGHAIRMDKASTTKLLLSAGP